MRIAEIRRPAEFTSSPAPRQSFYLTGGVPPTVLTPAAASLVYSAGTPTLGASSTLTPSAASLTYSAGTPAVAVGIFPAPAAATLYYRVFTPGVSVVLTEAPGTQLIIGGVSYGTWQEGTFTIDKLLNSTYTGSVTLRYRADLGTPKPVVKQEFAMFWEGVKRFGGVIQQTDESSVPGDPFESSIVLTLAGYGNYADRTVVGKLYTLPIGGVVAIILFDLWVNHLAALGVSYNYGSGPAVELGDMLFLYITLTEAFTDLTNMTPGWNIWIDDNKVLQLANTGAGGGGAAPFALTRSGLGGLTSESGDSVKLTISDLLFRNREWVIPSVSLTSLFTDTGVGDGVTLAFITTYDLTQGAPIVTVAGIGVVVGLPGSGAACYYIPGGVGVFFAIAPAAGAVIAVSYPTPFQLAFSAEDDVSIAAVGPYEHVTQGQNVTDSITATAMAQALVDMYGPAGTSPQSITLVYNSAQQSAWLEPGQLMAVDWTFPDIVGNYVVQEVSSEEEGLSLWRHTVTLAVGPTGDLTGASDLQGLVMALRKPNVSNSETATFSLAPTVGGVTNPGLGGGPVPQVYIFSQPGVLWYWSCIFQDADGGVTLDLQINGNSCLGPGANQKIIIPAHANGVLVQGFQFSGLNVEYNAGDVLTVYCLSASGKPTDGTVSVVGLRST